MNKAVFLDRDGVINRERGEYTYKIEDFEILPTVYEGLKKAQEKGFKLIVITNQGGIAKGLYSKSDVELLHTYLRKKLENESIYLTDIFYSPHHQDFGNSLDRKPDSLLFEKAMAIYKIDPLQSIMIGDSERDIVASNKVSINGFLIKPNTSFTEIIEEL